MKTITTDVVVVGAGAAGLLAAATARSTGLEVIVVESSSVVGGSTADDTGHVWLPANHWANRGGVGDTPADALAYLDAVLGDPTPTSTPERRAAFTRTAGALSRWLEAHGIALSPLKGHPDPYGDAPGARQRGRLLASAPYDARQLGARASELRTGQYTIEMTPRSARGLFKAAQSMAVRVLNPTKDMVTGGSALVAQLLHRCVADGVTLWLESPLKHLVSDADRVTGIVVEREGAEVRLLANNGVILAAGGFEANDALRREHLPLPTDAAWSTSCPTNMGEPMMAAARAGAKLADMSEAWWTLVTLFDGVAYRMTNERSLPHGLIVDAAGDRFGNEAGPTPEVARRLFSRNRGVRAVPSFLIVDNRHRQNYRLGPWLPGSSPRRDSDDLVRAESLDAMASLLGIDRAGLLGTVVRFNSLAIKGNDTDFGRGSTPAERSYGDPLSRRNPNLGPLEKAPYWAVRLYPGDSGTKGGVMVDADTRVLNAAGRPMPGLFAVSGTAASMFKTTSPGSGCALASSLVDAFRAALCASNQLGRVDLEG